MMSLLKRSILVVVSMATFAANATMTAGFGSYLAQQHSAATAAAVPTAAGQQIIALASAPVNLQPYQDAAQHEAAIAHAKAQIDEKLARAKAFAEKHPRAMALGAKLKHYLSNRANRLKMTAGFAGATLLIGALQANWENHKKAGLEGGELVEKMYGDIKSIVHENKLIETAKNGLKNAMSKDVVKGIMTTAVCALVYEALILAKSAQQEYAPNLMEKVLA